jgi:hypothetical protein
MDEEYIKDNLNTTNEDLEYNSDDLFTDEQ